MNTHPVLTIGWLITVLVMLTGCTTRADTSTTTEESLGTAEAPPATQSPLAPSTPPQTAEPDKLVLCLDSEPAAPISFVNQYVADVVLAPTDPKGWMPDSAYGYETRMLVEFPSFENGDTVIEGEGDQAVMSVTYRFRDDIRWSDGQPFTVDDVLFTRDVYAALLSGTDVPMDLANVTLDERIFEKVDDHTLRIAYPPGERDPKYFLPRILMTQRTLMILPQHVLQGMTPQEIYHSDFAALPSPTLGPYEFAEWVEGDHITLRAVEGWWGGEAPIEELIFQLTGDLDHLVDQAIGGACDYAVLTTLHQLDKIVDAEAQGQVKTINSSLGIWEHIDMNTSPPPDAEDGAVPFFADVRVRQAVAFGTNRQQMLDVLHGGRGAILDSFLPAAHWAFNPDIAGAYAYSPEKAWQLLEEAGWSDADGDGIREAVQTLSGEYSCGRSAWTIPQGTPFEVTFHTTTGTEYRETTMNLFAEQMADIGIQLNLEPLTPGEWFADDGPLSRRTFQIGLFAWVNSSEDTTWITYGGTNIYQTPQGETLNAVDLYTRDAAALSGLDFTTFAFGRPADGSLPAGYTLVSGDSIPSEGDEWSGRNYVGWCNPTAAQLLHDGAMQLDQADKLPYLMDFQRTFVEDVPSLPLFERLVLEVHSPDLCGPGHAPMQLPTWNVETWTFSPDCE